MSLMNLRVASLKSVTGIALRFTQLSRLKVFKLVLVNQNLKENWKDNLPGPKVLFLPSMYQKNWKFLRLINCLKYVFILFIIHLVSTRTTLVNLLILIWNAYPFFSRIHDMYLWRLIRIIFWLLVPAYFMRYFDFFFCIE